MMFTDAKPRAVAFVDYSFGKQTSRDVKYLPLGMNIVYYLTMKIRLIRNSIVTRLVAFSVLLLALAAVARYVVIGNFLRQDLLEVFSVQQVALGEAVARDIDYKIDERRVLLEQLAISMPTELIANPAPLHRWLRERIELQPLFTAGVVVVDLDGKWITSAPLLGVRAGTAIANDPDFIEARGGTFVVGHVQDANTETPLLPLFQPIKDTSGRVVAVLIGRMSLLAQGFLERIEKGRFGKTGSFLVISPRDKLFILSTQPKLALRHTPPPGVNPLHDRAMAGHRGTGVTTNAQGVEEVVAMVSVPTTGWFVVARLSTSEALASLSRTRAFLLQFSAITILLVIVLGGSFGYWLLRPLYTMAQQIRRMARRDMPLVELPVTRDDEVGRLAISFNRLLHRIQMDQQETTRQSLHDPLTGLPNQIVLVDRLEVALGRARRTKAQISLMLIDLDGFETAAEAHGRIASDAALKQLVQRLCGGIRSMDTVVRLGNQRLAILVADIGDLAGNSASAVAQRCIDVLAAPVNVSTSWYDLNVFVGMVISNGMSDPETLLQAAESAMSSARSEGNRKFVIAATQDSV